MHRDLQSYIKPIFRVALIAIIALVGTLLIKPSNASPFAAISEAEDGVRTAEVSVITDPGASNNSAVRFGSNILPYNPTNSQAIPSNLQLVFADEFNGSSLDLSKWDPNWLAWNATAITQPVNVSTEPVCYDPSQVSVGGGLVNLSLDQRPCTAANGTTYTHAGGMIQSVRYFNYTYGFAEAYINIPAGIDGVAPVNWPAFWGNGQNWPDDGEDDIMEVLDSRVCFTYHYSGGQLGETCPQISAGWHHFASYWQPNSVTYFYDGVNVGSYAVSIASPHYLIMNLSMANWSTHNRVPSTLQADYVRVWQSQ